MESAPQLASQLASLGLSAGDTVMLHASLRALGLARSQGVRGGAELQLDTICDLLGPEGTLVMILGSECPHDWIHEHPVADRASRLEGVEPFDPRVAPALGEVGWIAETFRRRSGTLTSDNPSGRFAAVGARAAELLRDQPWNDYYGPGSPLDKFCACGGKVLRLGANPDTTTVLHYAEYLAKLPDKRRTRWDYLLAGPDGARHVYIECLDDAEGIAPWDGEDYFALILKAYLALGRHRSGTVGQASATLIDATGIVDYGARWMETHLGSEV